VKLPCIRLKVLGVRLTTIATVLLLVISSSVAALHGANAPSGSTYSISVPLLKTSAGERVVSFEIDVTAGTVQAVSNLPMGWYVVVDNDASWQTKVTANTTVGAAALSPEQFQKIQLVVKKDETYSKFAVSGTISVTKDFEKKRHIQLKVEEFGVTAAN
jgi:hypothetical protein